MKKHARSSHLLMTAEQLSATSFVLVLIVLPLTSLAVASVAMGRTQDAANTPASEEISLIAEEQLDRLIADRKAELEQRRRILVNAIDALGSNHPSIAAMQAEREVLDDQIAIWSSPIDKLLSVEDRDLRVLVLQLQIRVDQLETQNRDQQYQIQRGQGNQNVFHSSGPSRRGPASRGSRPPRPPAPR